MKKKKINQQRKKKRRVLAHHPFDLQHNQNHNICFRSDDSKKSKREKKIKMGRNQSIGLYGKMKFCLIKSFNKRYYQPKN